MCFEMYVIKYYDPLTRKKKKETNDPLYRFMSHIYLFERTFEPKMYKTFKLLILTAKVIITIAVKRKSIITYFRSIYA